MKKQFSKILVANRGEIAVRVIRTAKKLGIKTIAVYAEDDRNSQHVQFADQAYLLSGNQLDETYLNKEKLIKIALDSGAEAIHPGYGFLSENADFAQNVEEAGLFFIGATAHQIKLMGEKKRAFDFVKNLEIPVIPTLTGTASKILQNVDTLEFPVLLKASAGGGGKGMHIVERFDNLPSALQKASRQAKTYFGNDELLVEKYLSEVRHIEVQVFGDGKGNIVHLFERECSIQRNYQKLIEEAPVAAISNDTRERLYKYALRIAEAIKYRGAGTIEFLVDSNENCYFLEMNTRLQVEHTVTELITGLDLVEWQLAVASGNGLPVKQNDISYTGHAIELRICAENPASDFAPSSGMIRSVFIPEDARWDGFITEGMNLSPVYDSLLGKLIVHAESRSKAIRKMEESLPQLHIDGVYTNQSFLKQILLHKSYVENTIDTRFIGGEFKNLICKIEAEKEKTLVDLLIGSYLLHHFYRPKEEESEGFGEPGYWRIYQAFQVEVEGVSGNVILFRRNGDFMMVSDEVTTVWSDIHFEGKKIEFTRDNKHGFVFVEDYPDKTSVYLETLCYDLKSRHLDGQFNFAKKEEQKKGKSQPFVMADLFGRVVEVLVAPGDRLKKGQDLLVIESMKTEFTIQSPSDAVVKTVWAKKGKIVQDKEILLDLES